MLVRVDFISVLLSAWFLVCITRSASFSVPKDRFLGIAPEDAKYYTSDVIKCRNGLKQFTTGQLNDDFCDCPDGTDEPGTAACPDAKFYCRNAGHVGVVLYSSRVNDGICDCCDGSDEYDGKVKCPNICWEAGKVARDMLKKKIATYQDGVIIRRKEVEHAKGALAKEEEELSKLKNEEKIVKGLVQQLKERKEQVEKAEKQHLENEKEEKLRKEAADMANKEISKIEQELQHEKNVGPSEEKTEPKVSETLEHDKVGLLENSPSDVEPLGDLSKESNKLPAEVQQHEIDERSHLTSAVEHTVGVGDDLAVSSTNEEFAVASKAIEEAKPNLATDQDMDEKEDVSENTEELSKEELGRVVASRWTGETIEKETQQDYAKDDSEEGYQHEEMPEYMHDTENSGYASQIDDDRHNYEHEDADDTNAPYNSDFDSDDEAGESMLSRLEKIPRTIRKFFLAVKFFFSPVDKSEAAQIRKEYEEQSKKLSKLLSRISSLSEKLKQDFGPEKEFYSFYGRCFESKQNKYVYKVCPFKESSQLEGHQTTRLGSWDKFEDSYRVMIFSDGEKCWNGPHRSMKVKLSCGLKNELKDVGEPSRCEYEALLSTPAACVEQKLKELQHELDSMDQKRAGSRDEL